MRGEGVNGDVRTEQNRTEQSTRGQKQDAQNINNAGLKEQRCGELGGIRRLVAFTGRKCSFCCEYHGRCKAYPRSKLKSCPSMVTILGVGDRTVGLATVGYLGILQTPPHSGHHLPHLDTQCLARQSPLPPLSLSPSPVRAATAVFHHLPLVCPVSVGR